MVLVCLDFFLSFSIFLGWLSEYNAEEPNTKGYRPGELHCPTNGHRTLISDNQIPYGDRFRAYKTIPPGVKVAPSGIKGAGYGVIATTFIPKFTWLGSYDGETVPVSDDTSGYAWLVLLGGEDAFMLDAQNLQYSSYLRWVNCARDITEENVLGLQCRDRILFITIRDIAPGHELLLYYGDSYAEYLNINYSSPWYE